LSVAVACELAATATFALLNVTAIDCTLAGVTTGVICGDAGLSLPQPMTIAMLPASARRRVKLLTISLFLGVFIRRKARPT
jgi:hypothetical protein